MNHYKILLFSAAFAQVISLSSTDADVIAATDFDGRIVTGDSSETATGLNWTLNGIADPGDMSALRAGTTPQVLFDADGKVVKNLFAPGINTGNGNTFWTTSVALAPAAGGTVTLSDVTFENWSVSGSQVQNVNRRSDFTVTLISPSAETVDSVTIADSLNGTGDPGEGIGTPVTATFATPIALTEPGIYTLEIKGGDFTGADETGNHTAIDNLSINGTVTSAFPFAITDIDYAPDALPNPTVTLTWRNSGAASYAAYYSRDLSDWGADLDDDIFATDDENPNDADNITVTFDLAEAGLATEDELFFRIQEQ